ncbi:hypothetical protein [Vibrio taketomensis]|uniref:hypothetical protein n=1 Tax=Vibrio taketomensis TaxID=2572923 RepID=UPI001389D518|nr:hypothetical protein [Vibrio taketomensis]
MKNYPVLLSFCLLLIGCSEQESKLELSIQYWQALVENNTQKLDSIILHAENQNDELVIKKRYTGERPVQVKEIDEGVLVSLSRYCFPDLKFTTYIAEIDGTLKVDHGKTMAALFKALRKAKTNKEFCYEFDDAPLQGKIDGKEWRATMLVEVPFLNSTVHTLYGTDTVPGEFEGTSFPHINLFKFNDGNAKSRSGNFGDYTRMTMYSPPGNNMSGLGSFRVSQVTDESYKLEITYKHDDENYISGYFIVKTVR